MAVFQVKKAGFTFKERFTLRLTVEQKWWGKHLKVKKRQEKGDRQTNKLIGTATSIQGSIIVQ